MRGHDSLSKYFDKISDEFQINVNVRREKEEFINI